MRIGNFEIIAKLGEGGMGEVFKGLDLMLDRPVAIKTLRPELSARRDIVERFRSEAIALAKLNHPNIATLYSFSCEDGKYYMVMEFVAGEPLDHLMARLRKLSWPDAVNLACQALEGLAHAHQAGIVHRDIKPSNMMLTKEGRLKLMDFGIARILQTARMTKTGNLIGTLEYMSPEQIQGRDVDPRSDLYSLGVVLFEMLAGRLPFQAQTDYDLIKQQVETPPPVLTRLAGQLPAPLNQIIMKSLAKRPDDRFPNARALNGALTGLANLAPNGQLNLQIKPILAPSPGTSPQASAASLGSGGHLLASNADLERSSIPERMARPEQSKGNNSRFFQRGFQLIRQNPGIAILVVLSGIAMALVAAAWYLPSTQAPSVSPARQALAPETVSPVAPQTAQHASPVDHPSPPQTIQSPAFLKPPGPVARQPVSPPPPVARRKPLPSRPVPRENTPSLPPQGPAPGGGGGWTIRK